MAPALLFPAVLICHLFVHISFSFPWGPDGTNSWNYCSLDELLERFALAFLCLWSSFEMVDGVETCIVDFFFLKTQRRAVSTAARLLSGLRVSVR